MVTQGTKTWTAFCKHIGKFRSEWEMVNLSKFPFSCHPPRFQAVCSRHVWAESFVSVCMNEGTVVELSPILK